MSWMLEQHSPNIWVKYFVISTFVHLLYLKKWLKLEHEVFKGKFLQSVGGFYIV